MALNIFPQNVKCLPPLSCFRPCVIFYSYFPAVMTSSILRMSLTTWVARRSCCCFPIRVSNTPCVFMSLVPVSLQSTPRCGFFSRSCWDFTMATVSMGGSPLFSASAVGIESSASANARIAYCSTPGMWSAASSTAMPHAISAEPPPYTMELERTRLRATQMASCSDRLVSSIIILFPPRTKMVTALDDAQSSMMIMRSLVVPKAISFTIPALPSLSAESSVNRGTMRPPVAIAMSSSSTPPTQRMAGSFSCMSIWFASSSKPHWQMTSVAPLALHCATMSLKYFSSCWRSSSYFSAVSMSILCFVLGLGGSNGHVRIAIFASLISLSICGCEMSLSSTIPLISTVSSSFPPTLPSTLIRSRFTSPRERSATAITALTQISAISRLQRLTIFEDRVVMHVCTRGSMLVASNSNFSEMRVSSSTATLDAISYPSAMRRG
mmetsp:Transcript_8515/g.13447  ORF Transcript_8515/g.13447 Transcript_8515/m.13447 type:complete len:438 (+) Transcript_8515:1175-2488(+)